MHNKLLYAHFAVQWSAMQTVVCELHLGVNKDYAIFITTSICISPIQSYIVIE